MTYTEPTEEPVETEVETEAPEFTLPEDFAQQVQGWDIPVDKLAEAAELYKSSQTEEGVIDNFIRFGQSLGFGIKELERLFADETPAPAAAAPVAEPAAVDPFGDDPDRLMTASEVRAIVEAQRAEVNQTFEQQQKAAFEAKQRTTFAAIDSWFTQQGITDEDDRAEIARLGAKTILPGQDDYDPVVALGALERGFAAKTAVDERRAQAYLAKKAGTAQAQPAVLGGGGTTGGEDVDEAPAYAELGGKALSTAKQRVRDRLRQAGQEL